MQVIDREKFYAGGKDFVIVVLTDAEGMFHSEMYEVINTIAGTSDHTQEALLASSKERIVFDITAKQLKV